jgi:hypothetical protein
MARPDTIALATASVEQLPAARHGRRANNTLTPHGRIEERMEREVEAMALYALGVGVGVPTELMDQVSAALPASENAESAEDRITALAAAHLGLTKLLAPAKPGSILLLVEQRRDNKVLRTFGAVPLVRFMLAIAVLSLLTLLGISLSPHVNAVNMTKGLLNLFGSDLLCIEIFLVAAAAVGASLANLRRLDKYVSNCTYEQRFESSYWTRLVMGVISGVILSQVVYSAITGSNPDATSTLSSFGQPVLALLGGFSADLVHDILNQFISVFGNLLAGRAPKTVASDKPAT